MFKFVVIVESPGKIKKIQEYLGDDYIVKASCGHIRDLDKKSMSVDINNNFKPIYTINKDKTKIINDFKKLIKQNKEIIIASDNDREGESIAFSLKEVLGLDNPKRIIFNEITSQSINYAINNPITIDYNLVYAQRARRILDRLIGYKISPLLWNLSKNAKSTGRVQSVVLKTIIDKENEITDFDTNQIYYNISTEFESDNNNKLTGTLINNFTNDEELYLFLNKINKETTFIISHTRNKKINKNPRIPFITSTLLQYSCSELKYNIKKTMFISQKLFEKGYITYMRTDSHHINKNTTELINEYIINKFGKVYSNPKIFNCYNQTAHECIRPTNILLEKLPVHLSIEEKKLYKLIWDRTIESQMSNTIINTKILYIDFLNDLKSILIFNENKKYVEITIENIEFLGYLVLYNKIINDRVDINEISFKKINIETMYRSPPDRYNESLLIKFLEKNNIGRPSTYESIIDKILERKYIIETDIIGISKKAKCMTLDTNFNLIEYYNDKIINSENKKFIPTDLGKIINNFMTNNFNSIINIEFTKKCEEYFDSIAKGEIQWDNVVNIIYDTFNKIIEKINTETSTDLLLGNVDGNDIFKGCGKYGPYVKILVKNKWKYKSIKYNKEISLETAYDLIK